MGGARVRSGPAPDPNAMRRNRGTDGEWTLLPSEGRKGDAPIWPLSGQDGREAELWAIFWAKPQAVIWEQQCLEYEVALMVRRLVEAELPGSPANLSTLVRQMMDSLGLTITGMRTNRWKIGDVETGPGAAGPQAAPRRKSSARDRLTVVPPPDDEDD